MLTIALRTLLSALAEEHRSAAHDVVGCVVCRDLRSFGILGRTGKLRDHRVRCDCCSRLATAVTRTAKIPLCDKHAIIVDGTRPKCAQPLCRTYGTRAAADALWCTQHVPQAVAL